MKPRHGHRVSLVAASAAVACSLAACSGSSGATESNATPASTRTQHATKTARSHSSPTATSSTPKSPVSAEGAGAGKVPACPAAAAVSKAAGESLVLTSTSIPSRACQYGDTAAEVVPVAQVNFLDTGGQPSAVAQVIDAYKADSVNPTPLHGGFIGQLKRAGPDGTALCQGLFLSGSQEYVVQVLAPSCTATRQIVNLVK